MVLWVVDYLINFLSYYIVYRWIISVPFRRTTLFHAGVTLASCPLLVLLCQPSVFGQDRSLIIIFALLVFLILVKSERVWVLLIFPIAFFTTGVFSILVTYLLSAVNGIPYREYLGVKWHGLVSEAVFPAVFLVWFFCARKFREEREMVVLSVHQYLIALLGSVCLFFIIGVSQGMMEEKTVLADWTKPLAISMVIVGIFFVSLVLWQSIVERKAVRYKMENEYYQLCLKQQETHIREIVENDQKIRRFRHDINAHLTALEQCVMSDDMSQLKSYVERMRAETRKLDVQKFTGIGVVDAIISEWYEKAQAAGITWEWDGGLLGETGTEPFDLCVIFSNLLSNAVEAAEQVEEGGEKRIRISCGSFREQICIRVTNTCRNNPDAKRRHGTTKSDYENHGFGLLNIKNTVAKANGEFKISEEPGEFTAEILL
ncbi:MAG: GHKL domain-containing protein [Lachnospiraceae bacterium]|nr:GHKL domain-containing protein [Lachnospiraceae bacterium]